LVFAIQLKNWVFFAIQLSKLLKFGHPTIKTAYGHLTVLIGGLSFSIYNLVLIYIFK
jgi:hypothetical protein